MFFSFPEDSRIIDLSGNSITVLDEFPPLEELTLLNLTDNRIEEIEVDAFEAEFDIVCHGKWPS